jgi:nucleotide-binding universal stress UspA family protein
LIDVNGPVICGIEDRNGAGVARVARRLAERHELPLIYVHVLDGGGDAEQAVQVLREATAPGDVELAIEKGQHPADRLVELAKQRDASFLVVGNRGPRSSLLGSVSADVSRRAPCPVLVVPATAEPAVREPTAGEELSVDGGILRFALGTAMRRVA